MPEAVVDEEEQFRRTHLRLDIDGDAVACAVSTDVHLIVGRVRVIFTPLVDDAALEDSVAFQRHSKSSLFSPALRPICASKPHFPLQRFHHGRWR